MSPNKRKAPAWRRTQRTQTRNSTVGQPGAPLKLSPPLLLNTLDDVLKHVSLAARTAVAVPSSIERSQLRPPSLITDAPLKLWLKQLDSETLEVLYNKSVVACTKAKLLGQRNETAYRTNRIREITHRELEYRRTQRWARKRTNQELSDYIARFPKAAGKLAANLLRDDHGVPQTNNLKLDVAAHILKRRHQGRETYSPNGNDSV